MQHKFTTELAQTAGTIGIEDLHILGMMANRKLARAVADAAMGQLLHLLEEQGGKCGRADLSGLALVSLDQTLFRVWAGEKAHAAQAPHLSVFGLWAGDRPRPERVLEPGTVCP